MLRFINRTILAGLAREAVLGYIKQGKPVPQELDGVDELLLTVMSRKEIDLYAKQSWKQDATDDVIEWLLSEDPMRSWFGQCELGRMVIEEQEKAENPSLLTAQRMLEEHEALEAEHHRRDQSFASWFG